VTVADGTGVSSAITAFSHFESDESFVTSRRSSFYLIVRAARPEAIEPRMPAPEAAGPGVFDASRQELRLPARAASISCLSAIRVIAPAGAFTHLPAAGSGLIFTPYPDVIEARDERRSSRYEKGVTGSSTDG
jgi:hypothetical protein